MIVKRFYGLILFLFCCNTAPVESTSVVAKYSIRDFYTNNADLDKKVNGLFEKLTPQERIGQMFVVAAGPIGKPTGVVDNLIRKKAIGAVLMLTGKKQDVISLGHRFDSLAAKHGALPMLYSSDAEPSLLNRKISGTQQVPKTIELTTPAKCDSVAEIISHELLSMDIKHNYAPVVDMSPNNEAITNRSFGSESGTVIELASAFIQTTQENGIAATAKHFPGHGLVSGDSHLKLVTIDGEMKEVSNYIPLIKSGVLSIMVGHIAVINNEKYNTGGLPASCSRKIVTDLLKREMGFEGIVVTDAMNMGALKEMENASLKALEAGCDMILMEPNEFKIQEAALKKYQEDAAFKNQIDESVKKILRLKACLKVL